MGKRAITARVNNSSYSLTNSIQTAGNTNCPPFFIFGKFAFGNAFFLRPLELPARSCCRGRLHAATSPPNGARGWRVFRPIQIQAGAKARPDDGHGDLP